MGFFGSQEDGPGPTVSAVADKPTADEIRMLVGLYERGLITHDDFEAKKADPSTRCERTGRQLPAAWLQARGPSHR
jgi:hypothetical protein